MNAKPASLQTFTLTELEQFTKEGQYSSNVSKDFHLFYVGRDDIHDILKYLLSRVSTSLYLNMIGYDDDELNSQCMRCARDATITTVITLDKSQAGGMHEKTILASDVAQASSAFNAHFAIGQSATHHQSIADMVPVSMFIGVAFRPEETGRGRSHSRTPSPPITTPASAIRSGRRLGGALAR